MPRKGFPFQVEKTVMFVCCGFVRTIQRFRKKNYSDISLENSGIKIRR
jgi:hypothetical protein